MRDILGLLVRESSCVDVVDDVAAWWRGYVVTAARFAHTGDIALAGGFAADRLGWAFASGYQAALLRLFGAADAPAALSATESSGNHPRAIATTLSEREGSARVEGEKTHVTLGTFARTLYVVARAGDHADGRPCLKVVRIDANRPGVSVTPLPAPPFVPEVPHARLRLEGVAVGSDDVLPGDGYADYLKPFRTVEDAHVYAALIGWLIGVARRAAWPDDSIEQLVFHAVALRELCGADPSSPEVHVALAGAIHAVGDLVDGAPWDVVDPETRERWRRDRALLGVAGKARGQRTVRAFQILHGSRA